MYRQGDVLLAPVGEAPEGLRDPVVPRDDQGRVILALGEATGHAHAIRDPWVTMTEHPTTKVRHLHVVGKPTALLHEEHAPITLPPGVYRVGYQREYSPDEIRRVAD